jgi:hypothetical protein
MEYLIHAQKDNLILTCWRMTVNGTTVGSDEAQAHLVQRGIIRQGFGLASDDHFRFDSEGEAVDRLLVTLCWSRVTGFWF